MSAPGLLSEVEAMRRRVVEMGGKDEELLRMWDQCRDLDPRLAQETRRCRGLRAEVDKLNGRISDLDGVEQALGRSRQDCGVLRGSVEREREANRTLSGELDALRVRVRELEASESQLEQSETAIRQSLARFRSLTAAMAEDRKTTAERLRQAEEKLSRKEARSEEQSNLEAVTERLREERQQTLRSKANLAERIKGMAKEKEELRGRLQAEGERNRELHGEITAMRNRLQVLENREEKEEKYASPQNHRCQAEDNRAKELSDELDRLRRRLEDKEKVELELLKAEEDLQSLGRRFREEQRRSHALAEELEATKRELSRYDRAEKQEVNQEHLLLRHLQKEQVKSRLLGREVDALKEKLQRMMGTEGSVSRVQTDHAALQGKLAQQEAWNRELAREMEELTSELHMYRQTQKRTTGPTRRNLSGLQRTSRQVQTEESGCPPPEGVIERRSAQLNPNGPNNDNNTRPRSADAVDMHQTANGEVMTLTHTPGQPVLIKVTPNHKLNTATLEISSSAGDTATSYTSAAVIPASGSSPKQRITIIQNSAISTAGSRTPPQSPDRTVPPLSGSLMPRMLSPNPSHAGTPDHNNPSAPAATFGTRSPEPAGSASPTVFCGTVERQNSWQNQRSNSTDASPGVITSEDNKIRIHLGSPCIRSLNGMSQSVPPPAGPYQVRHEQRTQLLGNGCHVKGVGKITSSITISPDTSSVSHSSNITVSGLCD